VVIVKHNNPCGVGRGSALAEAYRRALECDPDSAFGSIVAVNRALDGDSAAAMSELFIEVVLAPEFDRAALRHLTAKQGLRLLKSPVFEPRPEDLEIRAIAGGALVQTPDVEIAEPSSWNCPTAREPSPAERSALEFLWKVIRHVKSNAVVIGTADQTVGIGAGQMSRVDACRLAIDKASLPTRDCVAASDAFFPFADGLEVLAAAGVTAVVQPGGSKRDAEVVEAANQHGVAMLFTGRRHFKH
jgi:phosphoribosylaminoimidazolecarboxamide formyltransferase/IMP cyclohydrolase